MGSLDVNGPCTEMSEEVLFAIVRNGTAKRPS